MAGYIGSKASVVSSGAERKKVFTITTTTTSLTGLNYTPNFVHVFHNGIRLVDGTDYTATNGTTITLTNAAENGDEVVVVSYATFQTSDTVSASAGGTFSGDVTVDGDITITQTAGGTFLKFDVDGTIDEATIGMDTTDLIVSVDPTNIRASSDFVIKTDGSERLRLNSSGSLLLGKTSSDISLNGFETDANGYTKITRTSGTANVNTVLLLNRRTTDGDIIDLRKDDTTVGSIGVNSSDQLYISRSAGSQGIKFKNGGAIPCNADGSDSDNDQDLGISSVRWDDVYATNGTIQTSDRNEKQDIAELDEAEKRVAVAAKGLIRKYRWKDAVAEKGDEARIHVGIIAQDLQDAFAAEGLDAGRYAMFISSTWWEHDGQTYETAEEAPEGATERTRLGVRYPELLAFIIGAM